MNQQNTASDGEAIQKAIEYIQPLCTAIKFDVEEIKSSSRKIEVLIQRALVCHHLRNHCKHSLYTVRDIMGMKAHASVINLLHFYQGKSNKIYRQYYLHIINLVFSTEGAVQVKFAKEVNEKFLIELAKPKEKKPYISKKKAKPVTEPIFLEKGAEPPKAGGGIKAVPGNTVKTPFSISQKH